MTKKIVLDKFEQYIEDNYESFVPVKDQEKELKMLIEAARNHVKRKKSITIRVNPSDLEIMQLKAAKLGIPYQTYINMLIHKDASKKG
ncbi:MAG: hypothetical protein JSS50_05555 [Proteobacteria bacterium]|nr:hypothetical protein [Pseudomonadota bacterium]